MELLHTQGETHRVRRGRISKRPTAAYANYLDLSFKLKEDTFPDDLGALGRWLFKVGFLDRDYAAMMKSVLRGYQVTATELPAVFDNCVI